MPRPYPPPSVQSPVFRICPTCWTHRMRLVLTRPSEHYINLDECIYRCECGEQAEYIIMHETKIGQPRISSQWAS